MAVAYDPEAVTREETPDSIRALIKQRTRWDQRLLARYTLAMPFLQAATGALIPVAVASMFLLKVSVPLTLLTFLPLAPTLVTLAVQSAALREFDKEFGIRITPWDNVRLVLEAFPYQFELAFAALRSLWRSWSWRLRAGSSDGSSIRG